VDTNRSAASDRFRRTVGAEEELLLFADSGAAAPIGEALHRDQRTQVEHEFKLEQAEIASEPTDDLGTLTADLLGRRKELVVAAGQRGARPAGLASSPLPVSPTPTPSERYAQMGEAFGLVAGSQLTCGTHVHVAVESRQHGVAAIDWMRPWLSVLVALSANSPYWSGLDSGYASYRTIAWGRWPTAGPTEPFRTVKRYEELVASAIESGAAMDIGMIYFDARLSARYPTVEIRVADVGQQVGDTVLVAALCRALVATALSSTAVDDSPSQPPASVLELRAASWRAARHGLSGELFDVVERRSRPAADVVDRLFDQVEPALREFGDDQLVRPAIDRLLDEGGGADRQRRIWLRRNEARDVIDDAVARFTDDTH
jgi:carboxylate-amine ligase